MWAQTVRLQGWLHQFRELGKVNFLILRDGWGTFQAFVDDPATLAELRAVGVESIIEVHGRVVAEPQAPGGVELHETRVTVLEPVTEPPPIEVNKREMRAALDTYLDHAVIGLRHPKRRAILRIEAAMIAGFRAHLRGVGLHRDQHPEDSGYRHRRRRKRLHRRLLRAEGVPVAVAATLQADGGRLLRARLRGRAGLPCGAARDDPPPRLVRQPRCRVRLHRGSPHGHGVPDRDDPRDGRGGARAARTTWRSPVPMCRRCRRPSRRSISPRRRN